MPKKIQRKIKVDRAARTSQAPAAGEEPAGGKGFFPRRRVSPAALSEFTTQLATLLEAGIPVVRALYILAGQMRPGPLKRIVASVAEDVEGGTPLSEALEKHSRVFDKLYTNMVRAGEAGGIQERILERLAGFMEKTQAIKAKVLGALAYPIVVIFIATLVLIVVMTLVVPQFKDTFRSLIKEELPPITQSLIKLSDAVRDYWWVWALGIPMVIFLHRFAVSRSSGYCRFRDRMHLKLPLFGSLIQKTIIARFSRTFGTLIESGVPHLDALQIIKASVRNKILGEAVDKIVLSIREGGGIHRPMGESGIFDDLIVNMIDVGEQTGELDRMLLRIADRFDVEVDRTVETIFKLLEPILIVLLACFVGYIIFALLSPMLTLMQKLR